MQTYQSDDAVGFAASRALGEEPYASWHGAPEVLVEKIMGTTVLHRALVSSAEEKRCRGWQFEISVSR